ncbi:flavin reductase family protein [Luteimicrobium subarcticum]|uniref:flavin reductase family protein n=1 Tax=Luteimicrobium subarcticum TaxID=620910 RepID=UPI001FE88D45|nr:flavin reductase family protein [Luteimicrobium subarcticum]
MPDGPARLSPDAFRSVFRGHPAGVAVVALRHQGRPVGFTATSVISVSADPPLLAFSLAASSSSWPAVERADTLTVSFLGAEQADVSARFATSGIDRFAAGGWHALATGEPVVDGASAWVRARVVQRHVAGSSWIVVVEALSHHVATDVDPLVFRDRRYHRLGSAAV